MKKTLFIISIFLGSFVSVRAQTNIPCCPEFYIDNLTGIGKECCMSCDNSLADTSNNGGTTGIPGYACRTQPIAVCKNSTGQFIVYPNLPTPFTYTWTVTGGTLAGGNMGNPKTIYWGNGTTGSITVVINGPGCTRTITRAICMLDKPIAAFTFSPTTNICSGGSITFTNTSSGAASYLWLFGDGTTSQLPNPPPHQYGVGTFVVSLIVSSNGGGNPNNPVQGGGCGCTDTVKKTINVGAGPGIETCSKMICPGDTVKYCSSITTCPPYNWTITGAGNNIIGPANQSCVSVQWNTAPGSLKLTSGCTPCGTTTITPNVIWPVLPYTGPTTVCVGSTNTYSVPTIPGTFYNWTISPAGATILNGTPAFPYPNNYPVYNPMVNVNFAAPGTYILTCNYNNPNTRKNCGGTTTIIINAISKFTVKGVTTFCQNTSGVFSTADGSGAVWTITGQAGGFTPPTFSNGPSINVTWLLPGTYVLKAVPLIPGNYCNPTGVTISIVVNPSPILNFVAPQLLVCPNSLVNYTVTSNVTGPVTWNFQQGSGTINPYGLNNTSASVQFTGTGPWILKASQTANNCKGNVTVNITAVPPPPPITLSPGATTCSGGTITASVPPSIPPGGYTWSCSPGAVLTGGQGTLSATFTVNSNAIIKISSCGGTSTANVSVTPATVTITRVNIPCAATLTATPGGGTYSWFLNGNPIGGGNPITITQNGTYVVQATYPGGCMATNQLVVTGITPVTISISGIGNLCNGNVVLTASVSANCTGANYLWSNAMSGNPITVNAPGSYTATVTCANGCTAVSNTIAVLACDTITGTPCINDLVISPSTCANPVSLTTNIPPGCTPSGTSWNYGDGYSGSTGNHMYANVGNYTVYAVMTCTNGIKHCGSRVITIPMVDSFTYVITCNPPSGWKVLLQDASIYLPAYAGYSINWTTSCGSLSNAGIANPILTVPVGCNPTVTLTISKNGCTLTKTFTFSFPNTTFSIIGNPNPCKNGDYIYGSSFTAGIIAYAWNFGDGTTGVTNPITHHFNGTPPNPIVTLTVTDQWGCQFTTNTTFNVIIPPALTITPSPLVKICPNCQPPAILSTSPLTGFTGYQWYQNGSPIGGANSSTYTLCTFNASGTYYVKATSNTGPCPVTSDTVNVVYNPLPDAIIHPRNNQCVGTFPTNLSTLVYSGANYNANYTYTWYLNNTGNQIYTSSTTNYLTYTVAVPGCNVFIVKVLDTSTGCYAYDTACICFSQSPTVTIAPPGGGCAGIPVTFTATAGPLPSAQYTYVWQDGTQGQNYTTSLAGQYTVTAFDKYGCSGSASVNIKPLPYVELFPQGCDTLCDTAH